MIWYKGNVFVRRIGVKQPREGAGRLMSICLSLCLGESERAGEWTK